MTTREQLQAEAEELFPTDGSKKPDDQVNTPPE